MCVLYMALAFLMSVSHPHQAGSWSPEFGLMCLCVLTPDTGLGTPEVPNKFWPEGEGLCPMGGSATVTGQKKSPGYLRNTDLTATEGRWGVECTHGCVLGPRIWAARTGVG